MPDCILSAVEITELPNYLNKEFVGDLKLKFNLRLIVFKAKWYTPLGKKNELHLLPSHAYYIPFCLTPVLDIPSRHLNYNSEIKILTIGKFQNRKRHLLLLKHSKFYQISIILSLQLLVNAHRTCIYTK